MSELVAARDWLTVFQHFLRATRIRQSAWLIMT